MNSDFSLNLKSAMRLQMPTWISTALDFHFTGIVVGLSRDWCVVEVVDEAIRLNGFESFRISDISNVRASPQSAFINSALNARNIRPILDCPVEIGDTAQLLISGAAKFPVLVIHKYHSPISICFGVVLRVEEGIAWMHEMDQNDAVWRSKPTSHKLTEITQVSFGGGHEEALALVGGPPPSAIVPLRTRKPAS
jgi:hypothetical protein